MWESNYGKVHQDGAIVSVIGNRYRGSGEVVKGVLFLTWLDSEDGSIWVSAYTKEAKVWSGYYGRPQAVVFDEGGEPTGRYIRDAIFVKE